MVQMETDWREHCSHQVPANGSDNGEGLRMMVDVRLYDNGMLTINNVPMMNDKADVAMTAAVGVFVDMMIELKLQGVARTTPEAA